MDEPDSVALTPDQFLARQHRDEHCREGTASNFRTGDALAATVNYATHQMTITRYGVMQYAVSMSMGMTANHRQIPKGA
ncbi:hypothetical protein [Mycobacterium lepromatosis]|uniref:hypothetical protein n=1 Tax=Mycobacterium lepromatosis TaxID=480418 RepID=UPI0012DFFD5E|nr:hypothetical protein [Mycobacterium lepromatosis]